MPAETKDKPDKAPMGQSREKQDEATRQDQADPREQPTLEYQDPTAMPWPPQGQQPDE